VKDARSEAQKEIEEYRSQKENEFKQFEAEVGCPAIHWPRHTNERHQHTSGNKKMEEDANRETGAKLEEIKKVGKEKGNKVVEDLLQAVMDVHPEPPSKS
jgi:V-type H+-transporting ATPase subunit G